MALKASSEVQGRLLSDQDRPLIRLYFYITDGCNLRCRHCWIAPKFEHEAANYPNLDLELMKFIITQAKPLGLLSVKLTGGEPLLHPNFIEMLHFLAAEEVKTTVETNGILVTPELAHEIACATQPFVSVSLDGSEASTHEWIWGVKGCFEATLQGIRFLVEAGLRPQLIMTLMRRNKDQMLGVVHLAEELGAGSVKFNVMQPTARGELMHQGGEALSIEELVELGHWVEFELSQTSRLRLIYDHPAAFRPLGSMFGPNGDGCAICGIFGILGVLADGSYALCGIGENMPDLVFGHASSDRLEDVWRQSKVLCDIRHGLPDRLEGICSTCLMRGQCLGSCVAQNYYLSKSLWAPNWFCQRAYESGLFPYSRLAAPLQGTL